jgi:hypothetical protein
MKWGYNFPAVLLLGNASRLESGLRFRNEWFELKLENFLALLNGIIIFQAIATWRRFQARIRSSIHQSKTARLLGTEDR